MAVDAPESARSLMQPVSIRLTVASLARSRRFYGEVLGLEAPPFLEFVEEPGAARSVARAAGLFHMAILLPGRAALAAAVRRLAEHGYPLQGAADHWVSEAVYLEDPDGHGIELYCDRPRGEWRWQDGRVAMATEALDMAGLLREPEIAWDARAARLGHVHLRVSALEDSREFYRGFGFAVTCEYPGAVFLATGGYHHHVAVNVWQSRGAAAAGEGAARLLGVAFTGGATRRAVSPDGLEVVVVND